jgi:hypothetical protein
MAKQNDNTETIEIRLVVTARSDDPKLLAAKWMRSNKFEALDFLAQGKKAEIIADGGGTQNQILGAKVESAAFFTYLASSLNAQIAVEKGSIPEVADVSPLATPSASMPVTLPRSPEVQAELSTPEQSPPPGQPLKPDDDDDDWDDDDDEVIITLAPGMK